MFPLVTQNLRDIGLLNPVAKTAHSGYSSQKEESQKATERREGGRTNECVWAGGGYTF